MFHRTVLSFSSVALVLTAAGGTLIDAVPAEARRPTNPVLVQITHNTEGMVEAPQINSERGNSIVFVSDGDVLGPGTATGTREIYIYSSDDGLIRRITDSGSGESFEPTRLVDEKHSPRLPLVAFISTGDFVPSVGNADGNAELFGWIAETGEFLQFTDTAAPVQNAEPFASDSAKCIVFRSSGDLDNNDGSDERNPGAGFTNPDGSDEVFNLWFGNADYTGEVYTQVSNGPAGTISSKPKAAGFWFTRQCRSTAYQSDHDQLGNGSTGQHIYNYTKTSARIEQLSEPGPGNNRDPGISAASPFARGPFVVWQSDQDMIGNGPSISDIYRFRLFKPEIIQYTNDPLPSTDATVSDGGGIVAFTSQAELIDPRRRILGGGTPPFNADGNPEVYRLKSVRRAWQITQSSGCTNEQVTMRDNGRALTFVSDCDLIPGQNPDGVKQVFHYFDVHRNDPLYTASGCTVAESCCNEANGCYQLVYGGKVRIKRSRLRPPWAAEGGD